MGKTTFFTAAAMLAAIGGSGSAYGQRNPVDRVSNPAKFDYANVGIAPADMNPPFVRDGVVSELQRFAAITPGLEQARVQTLLGAPIRQQGREWDYNFQLRMEQSDNFLVCQYKVVFDDQQLVRETVWRRRQCQQLVGQQLVGASSTGQ